MSQAMTGFLMDSPERAIKARLKSKDNRTTICSPNRSLL